MSAVMQGAEYSGGEHVSEPVRGEVAATARSGGENADHVNVERSSVDRPGKGLSALAPTVVTQSGSHV